MSTFNIFSIFPSEFRILFAEIAESGHPMLLNSAEQLLELLKMMNLLIQNGNAWLVCPSQLAIATPGLPRGPLQRHISVTIIIELNINFS